MESQKPSWYIPRASLGSISSSSNSSSSSRGRVNRAYKQDLGEPSTSSSNSSTHRSERRFNKLEQLKYRLEDGDVGRPSKRGSQSSQGSTGSKNSSHSTSSLLLTVANLENFAKIQENQQSTETPLVHTFNRYSSNILHPHSETSIAIQSERRETSVPISEIHNNLLFNIRTNKTKDVDQVSIASSTHFTMVNGNVGPNRRKSSGICKRTHQASILITTMSFIFMIGILAAVYMLEIRAQKMPR